MVVVCWFVKCCKVLPSSRVMMLQCKHTVDISYVWSDTDNQRSEVIIRKILCDSKHVSVITNVSAL